MNNLKPLLKRIGAYLIDLLVVWFLSLIVSMIPVFTKSMNEYQKHYDKYVEDYNKYTEYITLLDDSYKDKEITEEEYTKLLELKKFEEIINPKYEDKVITQEEYQEITETINSQLKKELSDYNYLLSKKGIFTSIITLSCTLLYFGVIQYLLKGQTIGKKILKIKVVSASDKPINIFNYLLRTLIVNEVLLNTISVIFLVYATRGVYTSVREYVGIAISVVEAIIIFLVMTREDQRGLHDILFNTKVISLEEPQSKINKKTIDAEYQETK